MKGSYQRSLKPGDSQLENAFKSSGARRIRIVDNASQRAPRFKQETQFAFNSYEILMVLMNCVRGNSPSQKALLDPFLWSKGKKALATALVAPPRQRGEVLEGLGLRVATLNRAKHKGRATSKSATNSTSSCISSSTSSSSSSSSSSSFSSSISSSLSTSTGALLTNTYSLSEAIGTTGNGRTSQQEVDRAVSSQGSTSGSASSAESDEDRGGDSAEALGSFVVEPSDPKLVAATERYTQQAMQWVDSMLSKPEWPRLRPLVERLLEVDPRPMVTTSRDGFAAETWVCQQLGGNLPQGWELLESGVVESVIDANKNLKLPGEKGVKGEIDGILLDSSGLCSAVMEVKIGGNTPYNSLYSDLKKMLRLLEGVQGRSIVLSGEEVGRGGGRTVTFAPQVTPCYVVVRDGSDPIDGENVLLQAEKKLLEIQLSMVLGMESTWTKTNLMEVKPDYCQLQVPPALVDRLRSRVNRDFFQVLSTCDIYEMPRPGDASW